MVAFRSRDAAGRPSGLLLRSVLYALLALGLIVLDKRYDQLGRIRRVLSVVVYPLELAVTSPFEGWHWLSESVTTREVLRAENARLRAQLRDARFGLQRYAALEAENLRLRDLRNATAGVSARYLVGNIMDVDLDAFRERVLVDKGAGQGLYVGQAVLDAHGVFGQVDAVNAHTADVILISDATSEIPVMINRTGQRTIAVGTGDPGRLKLPYLPTTADVRTGDLLVTSGLGGVYPEGYPVGTVTAVRHDPTRSLADVDVRSAATIDSSRELLFIWATGPAHAPVAQPTPAPAAVRVPARAPAPARSTPRKPAPVASGRPQ
ncbi:MAG: rod shape-determining protein MreC [Gammaproteobacteria bacterium]|nr:rod shape-determining protein MreC [Gammaproteobacteria bacterium]